MTGIELLQSVATPWLDRGAYLLTHAGSEAAFVVALSVTYLAIDAAAGRHLALAVVASHWTNQALKGIVDAPRPFEVDPSLLRVPGAVETAPGASFPSGHAQVTATFWTLAAWHARRRGFTLAAAVVTVVVAWTRPYLGVHTVADVVAGVAIGAAVAAAAVAIVVLGVRLPGVAVVALGVGVPVAAYAVAATPDAARLGGAFAGFATAPLAYRHVPRGGVARRATTALVGLAAAGAVLAGVAAVEPNVVALGLPEEGVAAFAGFGAAYAGWVVAPWGVDLAWGPGLR